MRARDRFKVGDRVKATPVSKNLFRYRDWMIQRGVVVGFGRGGKDDTVRVKRDDVKTDHEAFWELDL